MDMFSTKSNPIFPNLRDLTFLEFFPGFRFQFIFRCRNFKLHNHASFIRNKAVMPNMAQYKTHQEAMITLPGVFVYMMNERNNCLERVFHAAEVCPVVAVRNCRIGRNTRFIFVEFFIEEVRNTSVDFEILIDLVMEVDVH